MTVLPTLVPVGTVSNTQNNFGWKNSVTFDFERVWSYIDETGAGDDANIFTSIDVFDDLVVQLSPLPSDFGWLTSATLEIRVAVGGGGDGMAGTPSGDDRHELHAQLEDEFGVPISDAVTVYDVNGGMAGTILTVPFTGLRWSFSPARLRLGGVMEIVGGFDSHLRRVDFARVNGEYTPEPAYATPYSDGAATRRDNVFRKMYLRSTYK